MAEAKTREWRIQQNSGWGTAAMKPVTRIVDPNRSFAVQARHDYHRGFMSYRYVVTTDMPFVNAVADERYIFKGGNCLDIQMARIVGRDEEGVRIIEDPMRFLVTTQEGKPKVMFYRKTVEDIEQLQPFTFQSPTGEERFDLVKDVSDLVGVHLTGVDGGFAVEVTIPDSLYNFGFKHLHVAGRQDFALDVGYIFGNREGDQATGRFYWSNNGFAANILNDIPNESRLVPEEWGTGLLVGIEE